MASNHGIFVSQFHLAQMRKWYLLTLFIAEFINGWLILGSLGTLAANVDINSSDVLSDLSYWNSICSILHLLSN